MNTDSEELHNPQDDEYFVLGYQRALGFLSFNNVPSALQAFLELASYLEGLNNPFQSIVQLRTVYNFIANLYIMVGDLQKAKLYNSKIGHIGISEEDPIVYAQKLIDQLRASCSPEDEDDILSEEEVLYQEGNLHMRTENYNLALRYFLAWEARQAHPSALTLYKIAECYDALKYIEGASLYYTRAIITADLHSSDADLYPNDARLSQDAHVALERLLSITNFN